MTDIVPEAETLKETNKRLDATLAAIKDRMKDSDVKLLWIKLMPSQTAALHMVLHFLQCRCFFMQGWPWKSQMELGGQTMCSGGREGYETPRNTI